MALSTQFWPLSPCPGVTCFSITRLHEHHTFTRFIRSIGSYSGLNWSSIIRSDLGVLRHTPRAVVTRIGQKKVSTCSVGAASHTPPPQFPSLLSSFSFVSILIRLNGRTTYLVCMNKGFYSNGTADFSLYFNFAVTIAHCVELFSWHLIF